MACAHLFGLLAAPVACAAIAAGLAAAMWPLGQTTVGLRPGADVGPATRALCAEAAALTPEALEDKGYMLAPGFLNKNELEWLSELHARLPPDKFGHRGANVGIKHPKFNMIDPLAVHPGRSLLQRVQHLVASIQKKTSIRIAENVEDITAARLTGGTFYHTNASVPNTLMFPWHQDAETWWFVQDHFHALKFYVFVDKPDPLEAGLQFVPFDILLEKSPELHKLTLRGGAASFWPQRQSWTLMKDDHQDRFYTLNFRIDDLACTPPVTTGDLVVLRGDVLHRTQPHNLWRTSYNILVTPPRDNLDHLALGRLMSGGFTKFQFLRASPHQYVDPGTQIITRGYAGPGAGVLTGAIATGLYAYIKTGYWLRRALLPLRCSMATLLEDRPDFCLFFGDDAKVFPALVGR